MYEQLPDHRLLLTLCIIATTLLIAPSLAQFSAPRAARFDTNDLWKGTPEVRFSNNNNNNDWFIICADSNWNIEVATAVCYHRGFIGVMLMDTTAVSPPVRYASCVPEYSSIPPLFCEEASTSPCSRAPVISCLLPGYEGCYRSTQSTPYFSYTPLQQFDQNLQDCGRDCNSLNYNFFGVAQGLTCLCADSNTPGAGDELDNAACLTPCQGDTDQACGGTNAISVYDASLGQCDLNRSIEDGGILYFTSQRFPFKYLPDSTCEDLLSINLTSTGLEIGINYRLDSRDVLELYTDSYLVNVTLQGGLGLETIYIADPMFGDLLYVNFQSHSQSSGGSYSIYFYSELNEATDHSTYSLPGPMMTTTSPPPSSNLAVYIGVGVAAAIVIIVFVALLSVFITAKRNRSKPAAGGHVDVNSATNVAYSIDNERVNTTTGNTPAPHSAEDAHRYATIDGDGGYYYAPTNGPQPPLPKPRDEAAPANQDAQYEELPGDSAGTPYQSLTKTDRQAYQELNKNNEGPSYTTLEAPGNEYLVPL